METIFDYNPTQKELEEIGINYIGLAIRHGVDIADPVTPESYKKVSQDDAYFDLGLLFECRNENRKSKEYFSKTPDRHQQYLLGFDDVAIPV